MRRYGFADEASKVADALLDAAEAFSNQLPEVFAGFERDLARMPVEYPGALKPQSWAAGAPMQLIRTVLGLDVVDGKLRAKPCLPRGVERLGLRNVRVHGTEQEAP